MPLPRPRGHEKANAPSPQALESLLPDNTPLEFRVLLSVGRVFLGTEEPATLEALLQQGPEWELLLALANRHGGDATALSVTQACRPEMGPRRLE